MSGGQEDERIEVVVRDRPARGRYEAMVGDRVVGVATYELRPGAVAFTHAVVLPEWEGRGVGDRLARTALDDARDRGLQAVPACSFIAAWIGRHPDYLDLVPPEERHRVEGGAGRS